MFQHKNLKPRGFLPQHVLPVETSNLPYQGWFSQGGDPQNGSVASRVSPSWLWRKKKQEWSVSSCWNEKFRHHLLRRSGNLKFVIMIVSDQNKFRQMCTTGALCSCVFEKLWSQNLETWANLANGERTNLWGDFKRSDALLLNICVHVYTQQSKPA